MNLHEEIQRLELLKFHCGVAVDLLKWGCLKPYNYEVSPNSFRVGDFVVTQTQWTKCDTKPTHNPSCEVK